MCIRDRTYPALAHIFAEKGLQEVNAMKWDKAAGEVLDVYEKACAMAK